VLSYGRWISYKRFNESIEFASAANCALVICGGGPEEGALRNYAGSITRPGQVTFINDPSTPQLIEVVRNAKALLFPGIEDFGIVPLEAQSAGVPVIARAAGGALETVVDEKTGFLIDSDDPSEWASAINRVHELDSNACRANALLFSEQRFIGELTEWLTNWGFNVA
jgi:glycosyltransferase involved in cell wall biosynthesis